MTEEVKLKPCPACGNNNPRVSTCNGVSRVVCGNNDTCGFEALSPTDEMTIPEAIAAWNHRPLEDAKDARIAELEKQVNDLEDARETWKSRYLEQREKEDVVFGCYERQIKELRELPEKFLARIAELERQLWLREQQMAKRDERIAELERQLAEAIKANRELNHAMYGDHFLACMPPEPKKEDV